MALLDIAIVRQMIGNASWETTQSLVAFSGRETMADLLAVRMPKNGDHFKWCSCRHFRDFCTHTWQDDLQVFRW